MQLNEKLKLIRKAEGYTQVQLAQILEVSEASVQNYENERKKPHTGVMQKLCQQFPEYTLWLMTGKTSGDQISPHDKTAKSDKTA